MGNPSFSREPTTHVHTNRWMFDRLREPSGCNPILIKWAAFPYPHHETSTHRAPHIPAHLSVSAPCLSSRSLTSDVFPSQFSHSFTCRIMYSGVLQVLYPCSDPSDVWRWKPPTALCPLLISNSPSNWLQIGITSMYLLYPEDFVDTAAG